MSTGEASRDSSRGAGRDAGHRDRLQSGYHRAQHSGSAQVSGFASAWTHMFCMLNGLFDLYQLAILNTRFAERSRVCRTLQLLYVLA